MDRSITTDGKGHSRKLLSWKNYMKPWRKANYIYGLDIRGLVACQLHLNNAEVKKGKVNINHTEDVQESFIGLSDRH